MLDDTSSAIFPPEGHGAPNDRHPQTEGDTGLPAGTIVFSADDHVSVGEDIFYNAFPPHLKQYAPRLWRDPETGVCNIGMEVGKSFLPNGFSKVIGYFEKLPGCNVENLDARLSDMDAEGIQKALVFPNAVLGILGYPNHEIRDLCFRIYNQYIAEWQAKAPGRIYAVGLINWWDPKGCHDSIENLKKLGLKTFLLPLNPFTFPNGDVIDYAGKAMTPIWDVIEAAGVPVSHHIGEGDVGKDENNPLATALLTMTHSFRPMFGKYIFGGILDRHPKLKIGWFEGGINWVVSSLQDATHIQASIKHAHNWDMKHDPQYYWDKNMCASFMIDPLGLELIDRIGVDRAMWSTDYPHNESTFGYSRSSLKSVVEAVGPENARKIVSGNIMKFLGV